MRPAAAAFSASLRPAASSSGSGGTSRASSSISCAGVREGALCGCGLGAGTPAAPFCSGFGAPSGRPGFPPRPSPRRSWCPPPPPASRRALGHRLLRRGPSPLLDVLLQPVLLGDGEHVVGEDV